MAPATELEFSVQPRIALLAVPKKLSFGEHQRRIIDPKVDAVTVSQLRIILARSGGISVEQPADQRQIVRDICPQPRSHGRQQW